MHLPLVLVKTYTATNPNETLPWAC